MAEEPDYRSSSAVVGEEPHRYVVETKERWNPVWREDYIWVFIDRIVDNYHPVLIKGQGENLVVKVGVNAWS